jgi:hypothetical protein
MVSTQSPPKAEGRAQSDRHAGRHAPVSVPIGSGTFALLPEKISIVSTRCRCRHPLRSGRYGLPADRRRAADVNSGVGGFVSTALHARRD